MLRNSLCSLILLATLLQVPAGAAISTIVNYQGLVRDTGGSPLTGPTNLSFAILADSLGGIALWTESHPATPVIGGIFNVRLGSKTPFPTALFANARLWLETSVAGAPLSPRSLLGANPYAFRAAIAESLAGGVGVQPWVVSGANVYRSSGTVGIGTSSPTTSLDVNGPIRFRTGALTFPDGTTLTSASTASGMTLNEAYNKGGAGAGRTITANAGAVNVAGSSGLTVNGSVGVGTLSPGSKLTVAGVIESTTGGIKFPDGTTQTTASRPRSFVACVDFSGTACTTIYCSCGTATQITRIQSNCTVTSETGSCSALSFSCASAGIGYGTCCVCQP